MTIKDGKKYPLFVATALILTLAFLGAGVLIQGRVRAKNADRKDQGGYETAVAVRVEPVRARKIAKRADFHGFLEPFTELSVSAQVSGTIVRQTVEPSDEVDADQVLFEIDTGVREIDYQQAMASLEKAESGLVLAEANWKRISGLPSDTAVMERIEGQTAYREAKALKAEAQAAVARTKLLLGMSVVRSPIRGVVARIHQRRGEFARLGQPLVDMIEVERLKLRIQIEDRDKVWIRPGQRASATTDALPGEVFDGTVHRVFPQAINSTHKFVVEIELSNANRELHPGFFMRGWITQEDHSTVKSVLVVPLESIVEDAGRHFAYFVRASGVGADTMEATRTEVTVWPIPSDPRHLQLVKGGSQGDLVVTKGLQHLTEQSPVRITN